MKLKCISTCTDKNENKNSLHYSYLKIGKIYDIGTAVSIYDEKYYNIVEDDNGQSNTFPKHCFMSVKEFREEKLNQILLE